MAIAKNLKQAQNTYASTTTYQDIDMSNLLKWRDQNRPQVAEKYEVRLGFMGPFTQAATLAARDVPEITATLNMDERTITYRDYTNIGIAVSTPRGLVTPVLRNCENQSVVEIERRVAGIAQKARDSKLVMEDLEGGHFSISNPGIFGSYYGTPLIPWGQVATFNLNSIRDRVLPINGKPEIRPQMIVSLTYDHRLLDGSEAVKFISLVKKYVQEPSLLRLE
ncbi:hypothetical protein SLS63_003545 [Diaporthe eres]|uniref:dihydrolipoyllysine-residue succinyltransferase n=1 Tax=Diaporthe eres TaxID=83184 RepID=A0ABR1PGJ8_DIAER